MPADYALIHFLDKVSTLCKIWSVQVGLYRSGQSMTVHIMVSSLTGMAGKTKLIDSYICRVATIVAQGWQLESMQDS